MDAFMARQPIFDRKKNVFGYELLYREEQTEEAQVVNDDHATSHVIANALMLMDIEKLTEGKKTFINFTKNLIEADVPLMLSEKNVVIELLETIVPDDKFINACQRLKEKNYLLALDDFVFEEGDERLIDLVDIIKVDFLKNTKKQRRQILKRYKRPGVVFLAEKVETPEEFDEAFEMGYTYFQGYFFSKPVILKRKDIQVFPHSYIKILNELNTSTPEYENMAQIIEADVALSYKLLRLINSPAFYTNSTIDSIKHALVLLGFKEIQKWIAMIILRDMGKDNPNEILRVCLARAKMGEELSEHFGLGNRKREVFLMGLFSMIDVIMSQDMDTALKNLPLERDVQEALLGQENPFFELLDLIYAYEKGDWDKLFLKAREKNVEMHVFPDVYMEGVKWASDIFYEAMD